MIVTNTYEEARLVAIQVLADFDCRPKEIKIFYDKQEWDGWCVDYEEFKESITEIEENG